MKNLPCQKRRRVVIRSKDGSKEEVYRCANNITKNYKNNIDKSTCENCLLRQPLLKLASTCKEHPPRNTIWAEPCYGENGDIIYLFQDGVQQPPIPQGYNRKSDGWQFESKWSACAYRQLMNRLAPKGNLQLHAYCTARNTCTVKYEECVECFADVVKIDGNLNEKLVKDSIPLPEPIKERLGEDDIPNYPGVPELLDNYWKAVKRWIAAGRPTRTDAKVQEIYEEFCSRCNWYDSKSQRCKGCGCVVKLKGMALLNKSKMETEHCPKGFW